MAHTADFFISYTHKDVDWARWIAWELQQANYTCVIQDRDFRPGQNFMEMMRRGLASSRHVIAVLSPDYFKSQYANAELNAALAADPEGASARLVPVRVRNCELDPILRARIYVDLVNQKRDSARQRLVTGIQAALSVVTEKKAGEV
jgi:TIR domain